MPTLLTRTVVALAVVATAATTIFAQPKFVWALHLGGPTFDDARALVVSPANDLRVAGLFRDSIVIGTESVQGLGNYDVFTARISRAGSPLMFNAYGGLYEDDVQSIIVDKDGNTYMSMRFGTEAVIGGSVIAGLGDESGDDIALVKINRQGGVAWTKVFGSLDDDEGASYLACDSIGNVYLGGNFRSTAQFGSRQVISKGRGDGFVVKINGTTGDVIWAKSCGGINEDFVSGLAVTPNGDRVYACGVFAGVAQWDFDELQSVGSRNDYFMVAYSADGANLWLKSAGFPGDDNQITCAVDRKGDMILTGAVRSPMTFDGRGLNINGENASDVLFARIGRTGDVKTLKAFGYIFEETGYSITTDTRNNIYIGGRYDSLSYMDETALLSVEGLDGFLIRLEENGTFEWAASVGGTGDDAIRSVAVDLNNVPYVFGEFEGAITIADKTLESRGVRDLFLAALECGPNTSLRPANERMTICEGGDTTISARVGYPEYVWNVDGSPVSGQTGHRFNLSQLAIGQHRVSVRITEVGGCALTSREVLVDVVEGMPKPEITRDGNNLTCSIEGATYAWFREGASMNRTTQAIAIAGDGLYRVRVTDGSGCTRWSDPILVGTTSVDDSMAGTVRVYPNPTQGSVYVDGITIGTTITVYDILGASVMSLTADAEMMTISLSDVQTGLYTLVIANGQSRIMRQVLRR